MWAVGSNANAIFCVEATSRGRSRCQVSLAGISCDRRVRGCDQSMYPATRAERASLLVTRSAPYVGWKGPPRSVTEATGRWCRPAIGWWRHHIWDKSVRSHLRAAHTLHTNTLAHTLHTNALAHTANTPVQEHTKTPSPHLMLEPTIFA